MRLVRVDSSRVILVEEWGQWQAGGSVAAALASAGWVALLQIHTSVPAWSTSYILGLILGKLLSCLEEKGNAPVGTSQYSPLISDNQNTGRLVCQLHWKLEHRG